MRRIFCTLVLLAISLALIGQQAVAYRTNFQRQSKCYSDVVWYGTSDGLYQAHHCAGLTDRSRVQSRDNEIVVKNVVDLYEELGSLYNAVMVAVYDGQCYQTFAMDTGHIFQVSAPQTITRSVWDKLKKDGFK
ncbi:hypothetical protein EOM71_00060 [Candidatus Falkowbacteria bacterium]|nr:hypothetical protein [Candidatus Falkowbacteria bacterium]